MKTKAEPWKRVDGFSAYEVSSYGRIRDKHTGSLMSLSKRNGYPTITLYGKDCQRTISVHILVALAFIGPKPEGMEVAHWDDVKTNNRVENLRWATHADNCWDKLRNHLPTDEARLEAIIAKIPGSAIRAKFLQLATRFGIDEAVRQCQELVKLNGIRFPVEAG